MDGTAIMQGGSNYVYRIHSGRRSDFAQYAQIVFLAIITSIGTAAVPSAGTVTSGLNFRFCGSAS